MKGRNGDARRIPKDEPRVERVVVVALCGSLPFRVLIPLDCPPRKPASERVEDSRSLSRMQRELPQRAKERRRVRRRSEVEPVSCTHLFSHCIQRKEKTKSARLDDGSEFGPTAPDLDGHRAHLVLGAGVAGGASRGAGGEDQSGFAHGEEHAEAEREGRGWGGDLAGEGVLARLVRWVDGP